MGGGATLGGGTEKVAGLGLTIPPPPRTDGFGGKSGLGVVGDSGDDTNEDEFEDVATAAVAGVGSSMDRNGLVAKLPVTMECKLPSATKVVGAGGLTPIVGGGGLTPTVGGGGLTACWFLVIGKEGSFGST